MPLFCAEHPKGPPMPTAFVHCVLVRITRTHVALLRIRRAVQHMMTRAV